MEFSGLFNADLREEVKKMGIDKCANCKYINQLRKDENKGKCKDCNAENNSKNWEYNEE